MEKARYDADCEATCRLRIHTLLLECCIAFDDLLHDLEKERNKGSQFDVPSVTGLVIPTFDSQPIPAEEDNESEECRSEGPPRSQTTANPAKNLFMYPELDLNVDITTPDSQKYRLSGRPDWGMGYGERGDFPTGSILIAVEAKKRSTFEQAHSQLLAYLAVMRQLRIQEGKQNPHVQGLYSDGLSYVFIAIKNDGTVQESKTLNVRARTDLKVVFNWVVALLKSAVMSSSYTSPTKPGPNATGS